MQDVRGRDLAAGMGHSAFSTLQPTDLRHSRPRDVLLWLMGRRRRWRVRGNSMLPLLQPDQEVLMWPGVYQRSLPCPGDIVVAHHPHQPDLLVIKWVVFVDSDRCYLQGLNPGQSSDSRQFGLVPIDQILGRVECRLP